MNIDPKDINTATYIGLDSIEGVSDEFKKWIREDCRERFRYCTTTYFGDQLSGSIDIAILADVLDAHDKNGEELEDLDKIRIEELKKLCREAQKRGIDEIIFN